MKKLFAMLLALSLLLCGTAFAEESEAPGTVINCAIEDGSYVIRIADENGDLGWVADDMSQDDSVVKLASAELVGDEFVVVYEPVGDGEICVAVKHYTGIACDELQTWDLTVRDGAVVDCTGGSYSANSDAAEVTALLAGEWLEADTQFTQMTIEPNAERGWDVEIVSPMTHGAYIFKTTIYDDCDQNAFVYDKGKFWDVPITDSDEDVELGEAKIAGTTGRFCFVGDDQNLYLSWIDDSNPDQEVVFCPAGANMEITPEAFLGEWVGDVEDGMVMLQIEPDGPDYAVSMTFDLKDYTQEYQMDFTAHFDPKNRWMDSEEGTVLREIARDVKYNVTGETVVYENGASRFCFNDAGVLEWQDLSEESFGTVALERPIGWVDSDYVGPGHHFAGMWDEERVSIEIVERMEDYVVTVAGANSATDSTLWIYTCLYDEETDSLISDGEVATKVNFSITEDGKLEQETVYDDGEAVFTINEEGKLIWDDKVEHLGEDRAFERAPELEDVAIDYGASEVYSEADMDEAIALIRAEFDTWEGCELHDIRYAGDEFISEENLAYVNSLREGKEYVDCIVFLADFHSPVEGGGAWEADAEYQDYQWWLAREADGAWELLTWGY